MFITKIGGVLSRFLTGWAQINSRDELPIEIKAQFDGEYIKKMSFKFDMRCFIGTIGCVLRHDGVIEGGTGALNENIGIKANI